jgi:hypothetical protein
MSIHSYVIPVLVYVLFAARRAASSMPAMPDEPVEAVPAEPAAEAEEAEEADENDDDGAEENEPADGSAATKKKKKKKKKKKAASSAGNADGAAAAATGGKGSGPFVPTSLGSKPCPSRLITGFTDSYVRYGQTDPPTIPVAELPAFRDGNFPVSSMSVLCVGCMLWQHAGTC